MEKVQSISRRKLLMAGVALSGAAALPLKADSAERKSSSKVIVTGGHPGDPEYGCGGLIARLTDAGHEVVLLYLNEGEPITDKPQRPKGTRVAEAKAACEVLRSRPLFAGQIDGDAVIDRAHCDDFRQLLEVEKPDAVFTHWPIDNHADHRAISMLVYDAWSRSRRRFALFYYEVSNGEDTVQFAPTHYVDITQVEARKRRACFAHASQNPERFYELQDTVARWRGLESGFKRAEGFTRHAQSPTFPLPA